MPPSLPSFRWRILSLIWISNFSLGLIQLAPAPVQIAVASEFALSAAQTALWINLPLFAVAFCSIPAGLSVDRFGSFKLVGVSLLLMATCGFTRAFAPGFTSLALATLVFGIGQAILLNAVPKLISELFPPRTFGLAIGIYTSGAAVGALAVFIGAPQMFGENWRQLFMVTGGVGLMAFATWLVTALLSRTELIGTEETSSTSVLEVIPTLRKLIRQKDVLLLIGISCCTFSLLFLWLALGFPFLVLIKKIPPRGAGFIVSLTMLGFLAGAYSMPALSDRLGKRKPFMMVAGIVISIVFFTLLPIPRGTILWCSVFVLGFFLATLQALVFALPLELESVSKEQIGACEGIVISTGFLASVAASPLLGELIGKFATATAAGFLVAWLILGCVSLLVVLLAYGLNESGWAEGNSSRPRLVRH